MNWYESVFELIDMRSFSNLWFWIMLAVVWSSMSHWVLGVPWDMVQRARKLQRVRMRAAAAGAPDAGAGQPGNAGAADPADPANPADPADPGADLRDLETLAHIYSGRILLIADQSGLLLTGFGSFVLSALLTMGFVYGNEFSQALFLLGFPMSLVGLLSVATARRIRRDRLRGEALYRTLHRHRILTQGVGMISIFVTAMWGMFQNLTFGALG